MERSHAPSVPVAGVPVARHDRRRRPRGARPADRPSHRRRRSPRRGRVAQCRSAPRPRHERTRSGSACAAAHRGADRVRRRRVVRGRAPLRHRAGFGRGAARAPRQRRALGSVRHHARSVPRQAHRLLLRGQRGGHAAGRRVLQRHAGRCVVGRRLAGARASRRRGLDRRDADPVLAAALRRRRADGLGRQRAAQGDALQRGGRARVHAARRVRARVALRRAARPRWAAHVAAPRDRALPHQQDRGAAFRRQQPVALRRGGSVPRRCEVAPVRGR